MKKNVDVKNLEELCNILGLPEKEIPKLRIRLELAQGIRSVVEKNHFTHAEAAIKSCVGRTVITAIMNGNLDKISTDRLIDIAQGLGLKLHLEVA
jgi:predicted XRE-type DNA-binding protein